MKAQPGSRNSTNSDGARKGSLCSKEGLSLCISVVAEGSVQTGITSFAANVFQSKRKKGCEG